MMLFVEVMSLAKGEMSINHHLRYLKVIILGG
jgi:hypothetical protein